MNMTVPFPADHQNNAYELSRPTNKSHGYTDIWLQDFLLSVLSKPYTASSITYEKLSLVSRELIKGKALDRSVQTRLFHTMNRCALVHSEMRKAACVYPILFSVDQLPTPVALFSFQEGINPFASGGALESLAYIPAAVRQYPFVAMTHSCDEDMLLGIDANTLSDCVDGPCLEQGFFDANGNSRARFDQVAEFCVAFQSEAITTLKMVKRLSEFNVFRIKQIRVQRSNGSSDSVGHFKVVDKERWSRLDPKVRLDLAEDRILDLVLAHLKSLKCIAMLGGELVDIDV